MLARVRARARDTICAELRGACDCQRDEAQNREMPKSRAQECTINIYLASPARKRIAAAILTAFVMATYDADAQRAHMCGGRDVGAGECVCVCVLEVNSLSVAFGVMCRKVLPRSTDVYVSLLYVCVCVCLWKGSSTGHIYIYAREYPVIAFN